MKTLLLIDGHALIHRAFHAIPEFRTKTGVPTNAVYGFASMLLKSIAGFKPSHVVVCLDTPKPTFRKKLFKEYQIHRPKMEDKLKAQLPLVKELLDSAGIAHVEKSGFEADDVIGTLATAAGNKKMRILILTGDRDIVQLVNSSTYVITPKKGLSEMKMYDEEKTAEKFGVTPAQIPDLKALMGDPSDNYKGVPGIGPKTAAQLIGRFGLLESIYEHIDQIPEGRIKTVLTKHKKDAYLSKHLATIVRDVNLDFDIESSKFEGYNEKLKDFFKKIEFKALSKRYFRSEKKQEKKKSKGRERKDTEDKSQLGLF